ncbi:MULTISPECIES: AraC family transcriptional regulator [unclassified Rhizobacter]|uniref:AraC family transcriptional regulator n=1 Tax=unclassified Rhizobacter TaxID=2640088 RepID=UPI00191034D2|nr:MULTISPECIES: AraC family transcriptional regulator [unclassified Rhizobacter]
MSPVLQDLRLVRASYCRTDMTAPWGVQIPPQDGVCFHFAVEGGCWLKLPSQEPIRIGAGDVALLPRGTGHAIADALDSRVRPLEEFEQDPIGPTTHNMRAGGGGARSLIVCCSLEFDEPAVHPLTQLMPAVLVLRRADASDPALPALLSLMAAEVASRRVGAATVMARLADAVVTCMVRSWAETHAEDLKGWMAGARDAQIGRALAAIHRQPGHLWTVVALAAIAGLSRSVFTERFSAAVGLSPARYLAHWRMHVAGGWLRHGGATVADIAQRLGYESEASFSRAFKRIFGVPPGTLRAQAR